MDLESESTSVIWKPRTKIGELVNSSQIPPRSRESEAMSIDMRRRGFKFVGSTICYAHMQATGMVNDHIMSCFRYKVFYVYRVS